MKIVGVTACLARLSYAYLAKEQLEQAAEVLGYHGRFEARTSIGIEDVLTSAEIDCADGVMIVTDVPIDTSRFVGKPLVSVPIGLVLRSPEKTLKQVQAKLIEGQH